MLVGINNRYCGGGYKTEKRKNTELVGIRRMCVSFETRWSEKGPLRR